MMMHLNQSAIDSNLAKSWAKRECSSASARILDVVDSTVYTTTLLVDTVAPLLLEEDEEYIIYLYGAVLSPDDFSENTDYDTSYVNDNSDIIKVGLIIDEINTTTNEIKLSWDGNAQDGTRMLTDDNLARLMISPYRHWVHMNIDCSSMDSGAPSTVLPSRTYDAFSVMDHNFAVWDGSSYHTATLAEPLDTTEVDIDVSATTEFSTGDSFMIDDESIYVIAVTSAAAVATITITDTNVLQGRTIIISTTDGIGVTATETDTTTTTDTNTPTFEASTGSSSGSKRIAAAANIATCLNANSRLTATSSSYVVTITQATAGADGNTNLGGTAEGSGATFTTDFTGGTDSLKVLRGASGTATRKTSGNASGNIGGIYSGDYQVRTAASHSSGAKLKLVTIHSAWGEELSGNYTKNATGGSLDTLEERRNLGSTYNEYLINHETVGGVPGAYVNMWLPTILKEGSIYETGTDFGFGSYKEDEDGGGELVRQILRAGEYNTFKMYDISSSSDFVVGGQLDLFLRYKDDTLGHITNINTRTAASNTPFALAVFEDELPIAPSLSVIPNQEDPFTPEFTWEAADEDLWYGLLHIDTGAIDNQYNGMVAHIPLNEDTTGFGSVYLENESGTKIAAIAGAFSNSYEGLAGFAKDFNGTSDYIKFADFTAPTEEMTVVVHIIPNTASGTSYIFNQSKFGAEYSDWEIYMNSSRQIVAKLLPVGVNSNLAVTLTSTPITVDGETPTCIILTFDKNVKSGNCKLFINGKIEDQSGLIKASGAINNWKNDTNLLDSSDAFFIGCDVASDNSTFSNLFDGKIEEIVIYNKCLYPVVPSDGKFIFTKPVTEISNQTALSYSARLFVKDYHNIRGSTAQEVAASSPVSYRKAAFRLVD
jgi:hypothetical protein